MKVKKTDWVRCDDPTKDKILNEAGASLNDLGTLVTIEGDMVTLYQLSTPPLAQTLFLRFAITNEWRTPRSC